MIQGQKMIEDPREDRESREEFGWKPQKHRQDHSNGNVPKPARSSVDSLYITKREQKKEKRQEVGERPCLQDLHPRTCLQAKQGEDRSG